MGAKEFQKNQKNGKPAHGVRICDVVRRKKIPNMAYQGFREKLFTKNGTKQGFTWLFTQLTMVYTSFIENF
jgi:hypothetical protein